MKKLKLFLSLCMMCLCVAVLCIGILAANSATYNINGNISYNMIDGVALVNTRVYKVAGTTSASELSTVCTNLSSKSFEEIERISDPYYTLSQKLDSQPLINTSSSTFSSKPTSVNIIYGAMDSVIEYNTYYIVIAIKNVSTDTGYVLNAYLSTLGTSTISNISSNANGDSSSIEIKSGEFSNIVIGLSYTGTGATTTKDKFEYTLNVSYEEKPNPIKSLLSTYKDTSGNSYWGVGLGQISADTGADKVKWRYVGDYSTSSNGTKTFTRYETYTSTKPTIGSGSVFVQETALTTNYLELQNGHNYFESTLRTSVKNGDWFNLTATEIETYLNEDCISPLTLPDLTWSNYDYKSGQFYYSSSDSSHTVVTSNDRANNYFWLMSCSEIFKFFGVSNNGFGETTGTAHAEFKWSITSNTSSSYWLRSPCWVITPTGVSATLDAFVTIGQNGDLSYTFSDEGTAGIRAAFQLA